MTVLRMFYRARMYDADGYARIHSSFCTAGVGKGRTVHEELWTGDYDSVEELIELVELAGFRHVPCERCFLVTAS